MSGQYILGDRLGAAGFRAQKIEGIPIEKWPFKRSDLDGRSRAEATGFPKPVVSARDRLSLF